MFLYYFFSARATLSRFLVDEAATRKRLAQVKGQLAKMERKKGDAAMIFKCFVFLLCLCVFFNIQNQGNK